MDESKVINDFFEILRNDPELFFAYKANIAMSFYDEYRRVGNNLSYRKVHMVANQAAKNFLDMLIKPAPKETRETLDTSDNK